MRLALTAMVMSLSLPIGCKSPPDRAAEKDRERLEALGYLAAGDRAPHRGPSVAKRDQKGAWGGYTYFSSGHASKGFLMDMEGNILHEWTYLLPSMVKPDQKYWRRMYVYPNGDALAVFEGKGGGIAKVDANSKLLWARENNAHHDLQVMANGEIYVLTRRVVQRRLKNRKRSILEDYITVLSPDGEELREWSLLQGLEDSEWSREVQYRSKGDILHTNTLEVLGGAHQARHPAFTKGRILLSFRHTNAVALFDPDRAEIVWYQSGPWSGQHQPSMLENGNLLVFDNRHLLGTSRIVEFDPVKKQIVWEYSGQPGEKDFFSKFAGSVARLPNGNTLVSLTRLGRAVEINAAKEVVWEYRSPFELDGRVASAPEFVRLPEEFPIGWAKKPPAP